MAQRPTRSTATKRHLATKNNTLYCSFCGKSQHEVRKLIAGPTVFICDECVDLCDEIIISEDETRIHIKIRVPVETEFNDILYQSIANVISELYPDYDCQYDARSYEKEERSGSFDLVSFSIDKKAVDTAKRVASYTGGTSDPEADTQDIALELAAVTQKFLHESKRRESLEREISELKAEYCDFLRKEVRARRPEVRALKAVMFLDIAGFSKMEAREKDHCLTLLRGMTPVLVREHGQEELNTWGDAIVINFSDPKDAAECAVRFLRHLSVEGIDGRVGLAWGEIGISYNTATGRRDLVGTTVDKAARLQSFAEVGEVIAGIEFGGLQFASNLVRMSKKSIVAKKDFAEVKAGDNVEVFKVDWAKN